MIADPVALIGIPAVLVCGLTGLMWWRQRRKKGGNNSAVPAAAQDARSPAPSPTGVNQIDAFFYEAERKLRFSPKLKGASVSNLPIFLIVGSSGAGKTSLMLQSTIDPELLAGQVYQGSQVLPTRGLNIWLARQTIFIEVSAPVVADADAVNAILKNLAPGGVRAAARRVQPARGIVLCTEYGKVNSAKTPDDVTALARPWNEFLSFAAGTIGVQFPVYVLFTKTDSLQGFQEFFSNLSANDLDQSIGATVRPFNTGDQGVYAQETSRVLTEQFLGIGYSLCDSRVPLLNREPDRSRVPTDYQFPRDFTKAQKNVVQFLVDIARPSQLQASPFLRGFYFCGTRRIVVEGPENSGPVATSSTGVQSATSVINAEQARTMMSVKAAEVSRAGREITEWLFVSAVFEKVILRDRSARGASTSSSRTDSFRAAALAALGVLGIALLAALSISYVRNRGLERDLTLGATGLSEVAPAENIFVRLDRMRKPVERLLDYRPHAPLSMKWGLYKGDDLVAPAEASYCSTIRAQVLPPLLQQMNTRLALVRKSDGDHSTDFNYLKAYMMLTTNPEKADAGFLSQALFGIWNEVSSKGVPPEGKQLLPDELRLYGALLPIAEAQNYCVAQPAPGMIPVVQEYLRTLNANDVYRYGSLLRQAGRGFDDVDYNKMFPNDAVTDATIVKGWFTNKGWAKMQDLLNHPETSLKVDAWVLGGSKDLTPQELSNLAAEYRTRYYNDYVKAWKDFLTAAKVTPYANNSDAVAKLEKMTGVRSLLVKLVELAGENKSVPDENVKKMFQPAIAVAANPTDYLKQLNSFKNGVVKFANSGGRDQDFSEVQNAIEIAKTSVENIALNTPFKGETDQVVTEILLKPITQFKPRLDGPVTAAGDDLCKAYKPMSLLLPFFARAQQGAPVDDVQRIFQPKNGQMWQLYDQSLRDSLDCVDSNCTLKMNAKLPISRNFIDFFNSMKRWTRLLYGNSQDMIVRLQLRAATDNHLKQIEIVFGDQRVALPAGGAWQSINWDPRRNQDIQVNGEFEGAPPILGLFPKTTGPWALFEWFFNAEPRGGGSEGFTWVPKAGRVKDAQLPNGQNERYKLEIQPADGTAGRLDLRSLVVSPCVAPVAK